MWGNAKNLFSLSFLLVIFLVTVGCGKKEAPTETEVEKPNYTKDVTLTPQPITPSKGSINVDTSPTLAWSDIDDEIGYEIEVATDYYFKNIVATKGILNLRSIKIERLKPSSTYYWHIRAVRNLVVSWWCEPSLFTTISTPSLLSPPDKSINISTDPILNWSTGDTTNTYTLEISTNENLANLVYNKIGLTNKIEQVTGLQRNVTYYWRVSGTNVYGTKLTSSVFSFKTIESENPDSSGACKGVTQIFYGGKVYNTVAIGNQCWLKESLNVGKSLVGYGSDNGIIEKRCVGDIEDNCDKYGGAYRWGEVFNYKYPLSGKVQGICPNGWHVPSINEFKTLASTVNYDGNALKEVGQGPGTNTSGFSAMFAYGSGFYYAINGFWSSDYFSDVEGKPNIRYFFISPGDNTLEFTYLDFLGLAQYALFVRCIKD